VLVMVDPPPWIPPPVEFIVIFLPPLGKELVTSSPRSEIGTFLTVRLMQEEELSPVWLHTCNVARDRSMNSKCPPPCRLFYDVVEISIWEFKRPSAG